MPIRLSSSLSYLLIGICLTTVPASALASGGSPHTIKGRWQAQTRLVRGAEHRFFLQVAESIGREGRRLDLVPAGSKKDAMHLRAGDVHRGRSFVLQVKNTRSAGPVELLAEERNARRGTLEQRRIYEHEIFEAGKMPRREWRESVVHEQRVDRLPPHLIKLLTASSPRGRRPQKGDRLRQQTLYRQGVHLRSTLTLFAGDGSATPVSIEMYSHRK